MKIVQLELIPKDEIISKMLVCISDLDCLKKTLKEMGFASPKLNASFDSITKEFGKVMKEIESK